MKQGAEKRKLKDSTETLDSQVKKAKEEKPAAGVKEVDLVSKGISRPSAAAHVQVETIYYVCTICTTRPELHHNS